MITILYNLIAKQVISPFFEGGYLVDGEKPILPDGIIELEVIETPQPINAISSHWQHIDDRWVKVWIIQEPEPIVWHDETRPIQIIIPEGVKNDLLLKKQEHDILSNHPDVAMLLDYVKNINAPTFNEYGGLYIYLSELFDAHKLLLESFGIQINTKANV